MRSDLIPGYKQPPDFCEEICRRYGVTRSGETTWRVRFSGDRVIFFGGYWDELGRFEYRRARRYGSQRRWILEKYVPAKEFGDPATWNGRTANSEGYLNQGPFPVDGLYVCTHIFVQPLTPTLVYRTIQSVFLGRLATVWTMHDLLLQQAAERERESDENFDREWALIDNPRRGMTFAGGQRLNQDANLIIEKATSIAAATGGKFREATSGFNQIESLEDLE